MENASKALIIAGAILVSILLISLGIMMFTRARAIVDNQDVDQVAVDAYNQQFTQYLGYNVRASLVNSLVAAVNQNNQRADSQQGTDGNKIELEIGSNGGEVGIKAGTAEGSTNTYLGAAKTNLVYNITVEGYAPSGRISKIKIDSVKKS